MGSMGGSGSLQPTFQGHVATTQDALILFEACLNGTLHHVPRRPHDRERGNLIRSGCVFIYEENASGIKRWTDGVPWSPSRILGNFLVYRELLKPFPPGEKKRAAKRNKRPMKSGAPYSRSSMDSVNTSQPGDYSPTLSASPAFKPDGNFDKETERALIGSLVDSYGFKDGGLVKKTMSVNVQGVHHHLVSYYKVEDVLNNDLETPSQSNLLRYTKPRPELTSRQNFRAPLDDVDEGLDTQLDGPHNPYGYLDRGGFERNTASVLGHDYHPQQQTSASHSGFYQGLDHVPYSSSTSHHSLTSSSYPLVSPTSATSQTSYYSHSNPNPQLPGKLEDYGSYPSSAPYASRFDPFSNSVGAPGSIHSTRPPPPQPQGLPQAQYRHRLSGAETSNIGDAKPVESFGRGYYSAPLSENSSFPPIDQRWAPHAGSPRSEDPNSYPPNKQYWNPPGNVAAGHGHYPSNSSISQWSQNAA
ncbi:MAG: hypothetical protein M1819_007398 [Sarea resinae]|nr:MAG: hypothetical protein M1819_007398 [Sarea resinae]